MARETQKQIIERLENEVLEYKTLTNKLQNEITDMQDKAENEFINSPTYQQLLKKIDFLEKKNKSLEDKIVHNERIQKLKDEKAHNERGAGRKPRFTDVEVATMKMYRLQGKTIREIAEIYECSVGLIHNAVKDIK